jgi:hypothetical protein
LIGEAGGGAELRSRNRQDLERFRRQSGGQCRTRLPPTGMISIN